MASTGSRRTPSSSAAALSLGDLFQIERTAIKALHHARSDRDYARMIKAIPALIEARMRRVSEALEVGRVQIITEAVGEDVRPEPGCYIVQPPQVAADARRLRLAGFEKDVPVLVLCREPLTRVGGLLPVVALSPSCTIRMKIKPPANFDRRTPDPAWVRDTLITLGDFALQTLDPSLTAERRVEALLDRLDALPEHEGLHHALAQACLDAQAERDRVKANRAARKAAQGAAAQEETDTDSDEDACSDDDDRE